MKQDENLKKYSPEKLHMLHEVATAMSINRNGEKLDKKIFYGNIDELHDKYPEIHPWTSKGVDRVDNANSDLSFAVRHGVPRQSAEKILRYRPKTRDVIPHIKLAEPNSPILPLLEDSLKLGTELMSAHGLREHKRGIIFKKRKS